MARAVAKSGHKWSADRVAFWLSRKAERQVLATRRTTHSRYVVACEEIAPTPMRWITVDNPTHLYLAGWSMVPTHNTATLASAPTLRGVQA